MVTAKTTYTIEITEREATLIMDALHNAYRAKKDEWNDSPQSRTGDKGYELIGELRTLRNSFCDITKTYFMGVDA